MPHYEVIVGNVGTVWTGDNGAQAMREYGQWRRISQSPAGRAAGESVTIMKDGEVHLEHEGTNRSEREPEYGSADWCETQGDNLGESPDY